MLVMQEFTVEVRPAENRSGVQVPPLLEPLRDTTLHCMFWNKETMLACVQAEARGAECEAVFDQPAPMTMRETLYHTERLPVVVKYLVQHRCYLRVWCDSGSLFFGPVVKGEGNVADLDDRCARFRRRR